MQKEHMFPKVYESEDIHLNGVSKSLFMKTMNREERLINIIKTWQYCCFACFFVMCLSIGYNYWQAHQTKLIPYVVEVDAAGAAKAVGQMPTQAYSPKESEVNYFLNKVIYSMRSIPADKVLLKQNIATAYLFLDENAQKIATETLRASQSEKIKNSEVVSIQFVNTTRIAGTTNSYHVRWIERTFEQGGSLKTQENMFANMTIKTDIPKNLDVLQANPLGIIITDISWSKEN